MKLSKRLEAVATLVDVGKRVIDVGCDHGYLDIYLTLNNENKCVATDINQNALNSAVNNIKKYNLEGKIETILTDGLKNIKVNKKDNIVICGMGTSTILDILKTNNLSNTLIISSNNNILNSSSSRACLICRKLFLPLILLDFKSLYRLYRKC